MNMRQVVGRNVRHYRRKLALTQEGLGEISGFDQKYLSALECGKINPTLDTLNEIAKALSVSYADLLRPYP